MYTNTDWPIFSSNQDQYLGSGFLFWIGSSLIQNDSGWIMQPLRCERPSDERICTWKGDIDNTGSQQLGVRVVPHLVLNHKTHSVAFLGFSKLGANLKKNESKKIWTQNVYCNRAPKSPIIFCKQITSQNGGGRIVQIVRKILMGGGGIAQFSQQ